MSTFRATLKGVPVTVVSNDEAEDCNFVICAPVAASHFADDVRTRCSSCSRAIVHRPHAPKKPPKVCLDCAVILMQGGFNDA